MTFDESCSVRLAILSAVAHGNGPNGLAVVLAVLGALGRLDQEHAAVYFQMVYEALREPMAPDEPLGQAGGSKASRAFAPTFLSKTSTLLTSLELPSSALPSSSPGTSSRHASRRCG